jgi:putative flippase GtrA
MDKIKGFLNKYRDILLYLVFGVLTTVVNYLVYYPMYNWANLPAAACNAAAWVAAVGFAYLTNKPLVFASHDWSINTVLPELGKFLGCRIGSGLLETAIIWITVDVLNLDGNIMKLITSVVVVILNYIGSKFLVFKR